MTGFSTRAVAIGTTLFAHTLAQNLAGLTFAGTRLTGLAVGAGIVALVAVLRVCLEIHTRRAAHRERLLAGLLALARRTHKATAALVFASPTMLRMGGEVHALAITPGLS